MNPSLLSQIASMKLKDMPSLVKAFTDEKGVPSQYSIIELGMPEADTSGDESRI
jgi:hypothetical protein